MPATTQIRSHAGHAHHHHHHDNSYLVSQDKHDPGVRITRIGLYVNLFMAFAKGLGGYMFHSQALIADAIHSLTDLVSDIMTLATVSWSLKPPSESFPSGYGKVESLGSLGVSGLLLGGGVVMGLAALTALMQQFFPDLAETLEHLGLLGHSHGHSHSHSHTDLGPNINAAWLAAGSIIVKEWLYRATLKIAKERKSSVLASNAYHHRVDSLTALVALIMIGGSNVLNNAAWLDPVGGLIISLMVVQAGWGNTKSALLELADVGVDSEVTSNVRKQATTAIEESKELGLRADTEVRQVQGVKAGQNYLLEVELAVPGSWSVEQTRSIEDVVRTRVGANVRGVRRLKIRFVPKELNPSKLDEFIRAGPTERSSSELEELEHGHKHAANQNNVYEPKPSERRKGKPSHDKPI